MVFEGRLHQALERLNPDLPTEALEDAFRKLTNPEGAPLVTRNHTVHRMLVDGVNVEYKRPDGSIAGTQVNIPKTTTGWPSISSPLSKTSTTDDRTSCSSSTACRWSSSNSKTLPTKTPPSGRHSSNSRPTRTRSPRCLRTTKPWSSPTAWRPA